MVTTIADGDAIFAELAAYPTLYDIVSRSTATLTGVKYTGLEGHDCTYARKGGICMCELKNPMYLFIMWELDRKT